MILQVPGYKEWNAVIQQFTPINYWTTIDEVTSRYWFKSPLFQCMQFKVSRTNSMTILIQWCDQNGTISHKEKRNMDVWFFYVYMTGKKNNWWKTFFIITFIILKISNCCIVFLLKRALKWYITSIYVDAIFKFLKVAGNRKPYTKLSRD